MKRPGLVHVLGLCLVLVVGIVGCDGQVTTTVVSEVTSTSTSATAPVTTATTAATTTTTTEAPKTWTELKPTGDLPSSRMWHSMAYDPRAAKAILFGGGTRTSFLHDTWAYDPAANTWTNLRPTGSVPSGRESQSMVYDPTSGKVILFGGSDGRNYLNDTWAYDASANTWTNLHPTGSLPAARGLSSMVYDPTSGKVILFGGCDASVYFSDTWVFDPAANTWANVNFIGSLPSARASHTMVYDLARDQVILFGGGDASTAFGDTWAYDPSAHTWTDLNPSGSLPSARASQVMVYDPTTDQVILFGGSDGGAYFNDTWAYDPTANTWAHLNFTSSLPAARMLSCMICDSETGRMILFGGGDASAFFNDTWAYGR